MAEERNVTVSYVFGEQAERDLSENDISVEVVAGFREYEFKTIEEAKAFALGLREATGWLGGHFPSVQEIKRIRAKIRRLDKKAA
jgi:hypothetical protein